MDSLPDYRDLSAPERDRFRANYKVCFNQAVVAGQRRLCYAATIKGWHVRMFAGIADGAGEYRTTQVVVGSYEGAVADDLTAEMGRWETRSADSCRELERVRDRLSNRVFRERFAALTAAVVGDLIRIHPFPNGNGRISRLVVTYMFARFGFVSPFATADRPGEPYGEVMGEAMVRRFFPLALYVLRQIADAEKDSEPA